MGIRHTRQPTEDVQFHPESILTSHDGTIVATFTQVMRAHVPGR
jgi:anthranilate/para-aminobenzoate synthase component II